MEDTETNRKSASIVDEKQEQGLKKDCSSCHFNDGRSLYVSPCVRCNRNPLTIEIKDCWMPYNKLLRKTGV